MNCECDALALALVLVEPIDYRYFFFFFENLIVTKGKGNLCLGCHNCIHVLVDFLQELIMAMNDQTFEEDALVDDLKEPLNVQDVQEPKSASSDLNAHVDALNKSLNVLDIQESEFASSDVNALESTSFDVNFLLDALNIQDDRSEERRVGKEC